MSNLALVQLHHNEPMTTSENIAEGVQLQHKNVLSLVRKYVDDLQEFGTFAFETRKSGGLYTEFAWLNEQQATLLLTYMRNSDIVRQFKKALVRAFFELRDRSQIPSRDEPLNLNHRADIAVAADRTFRAMLRAARSAGMRTAQAIKRANELTLVKTGVDMLAELQFEPAADVISADPAVRDPYGARRFVREWLAGVLPVPVCVCKSADLYATYVYWVNGAGVAHIAPEVTFHVAIRDEAPGLLKVIAEVKYPDGRKNTRLIIPPGICRHPHGESAAANLEPVLKFQSALAGWMAAI